MGEILLDTDSSNNYLTKNILTDNYCLSPYTCKRCIVFKQFDGLNFDSLAVKCQKRQNFTHQNFALYSSRDWHEKMATKVLNTANYCPDMYLITLVVRLLLTIMFTQRSSCTGRPQVEKYQVYFFKQKMLHIL